MKKFFSIGEMAKIHNVSIQTLRYYDKINLFKPVHIDKSSNYRYYSIEQFSYLDIIKYLKYLGMPLKDIKMKLNENNKELLNLLDEKVSATDEKIKELELVKKILQNKKNIILERERKIECGKVFRKYINKRNMLSIKLSDNYSDDEVNLLRRRIGTILENNIGVFYGGVGGLVFIDKILPNEKTIYDRSFVFVEKEMFDEKSQEHIDEVKEGEYLCIRYKGPYENNYIYFTEIINFINKNKLKVYKEAYEIPIIDPLSTTNQEDLLTEIQILIKK